MAPSVEIVTACPALLRGCLLERRAMLSGIALPRAQLQTLIVSV
jgi:hypothetical protein